jgi:hypothetical protein
MKIRKVYYHLTAQENESSIYNLGIQANEDGMIFLFENKLLTTKSASMLVGDSIAYNQVNLSEYDIWEVSSKGIHGKIEQDCVGELTAPYQYILHQPVIKPNSCKLVKRKRVDIAAVMFYPYAFYGIRL